jgi:hypothetical protein
VNQHLVESAGKIGAFSHVLVLTTILWLTNGMTLTICRAAPFTMLLRSQKKAYNALTRPASLTQQRLAIAGNLLITCAGAPRVIETWVGTSIAVRVRIVDASQIAIAPRFAASKPLPAVHLN